MDVAQLKEQWHQWIEKNIGGPQGRVEIAMQAAMNALSKGKSRDEAAAAARQAASSWKETEVSEDTAVVQPTDDHENQYLLNALPKPFDEPYDPSELGYPPFLANRENLDEEMPTGIFDEDRNGLRLADKALDDGLAHLAWRYVALVGIVDVEPRFERPMTESENYAREFLNPAMIQADRQRFPQFLKPSKGLPVLDEKDAVSFMMEMSGADEFVCQFILAREFPGGRKLRDLWNLWYASRDFAQIGESEYAMEPVQTELGGQKTTSATEQDKGDDEPARVDSKKAPVSKSPAEPVAIQQLPQGVFVGRVTALQQRQEIKSSFHFLYAGQTPYSMVWNFRLERNAADGTRLPTVDVELRSSPGAISGRTTKGIVGSLFNGDWVAVDARNLKADEHLPVKEVWNLTTNSSVRVRGSSSSRVFATLAAASMEKYSIIRGRVATLQQRQDHPGQTYSPTVWSFRLQRTEPGGRRMPLLEVEMYGWKFEGSLAVGDELELDGKGSQSGDVVFVKKVRNLTSNSVVRVH